MPPALVPQGEADNGDGRTFLSRDRRARLLVWGEHRVDPRDSLDARYRDAVRGTPEARVTYRFRGANFYVVSGLRGGTVYYHNVMHDLRADTFATLLLEYPRTLKPRYDPVATRVSRSFGFR